MHDKDVGCYSNKHGFFTWIANGFDFPACKCEKYEFGYEKWERSW